MFHVNPDKDIIFESKNCLNLILYKVVLVGLPYTGLALNWILVSPDNRAGVFWIDTLFVPFTYTYESRYS